MGTKGVTERRQKVGKAGKISPLACSNRERARPRGSEVCAGKKSHPHHSN